MRLLIRSVLVTSLLLIGTDVLGIRLQGFVRDGFTRLPLRGVVVTMERANAAPLQVVTRSDGHYRFDLHAGQRTKVHFSAIGRPTRHVVFDASAVPREWTDALEARMDMRLFPGMDGLDSAMLATPAGTCTWDRALENMVWDSDRSAPQVARWNALAEAHLATHPEARPSDPERWAAKVFDLLIDDDLPSRTWSWIGVLGVIWALYALFLRAYTMLGRRARRVALLGVLAASGWTVLDLATASGPLRFVALVAALFALACLGALVLELLFGQAATGYPNEEEIDSEVYTDLTDTDLVEERSLDQEPERSSRSRWAAWWPMVIFFAALFALIFEGGYGLENTLDVWSLAGAAAAVGLVAAAVVAGSRVSKVRWANLRSLILAGGLWWLVLPLVGITSASFLNRSFLQSGEQCQVWPVEELTYSRRNGIQVRVSWAGERERLEMPQEVKEQLTTLDSLRCCSRMGLLGHPFVVRVEPILTGTPPR